MLLGAVLCAAPLLAQDRAGLADLRSGQDLLYRGRFGAAQLYFNELATARPADPAGPVLEAAALIWWAEARGEETWQADSVDALLTEAVRRARVAADGAPDLVARADALFWLGTALGYRARQAELRGSLWQAARDAKAMRAALEDAVAMDSLCVDCLLGIAVYDYALGRAGTVARIVARIIGLGGGDADGALVLLRRVSTEGVLARIEARWVLANALLREGDRDAAFREEGLRLVGELALQFPDNPVFRRTLERGGVEP